MVAAYRVSITAREAGKGHGVAVCYYRSAPFLAPARPSAVMLTDRLGADPGRKESKSSHKASEGTELVRRDRREFEGE